MLKLNLNNIISLIYFNKTRQSDVREECLSEAD